MLCNIINNFNNQKKKNSIALLFIITKLISFGVINTNNIKMPNMKRLVYLFFVLSSLVTGCSKDADKENETSVSNITFTGCTDSLISTSFDSTCIAIETNDVNYLVFTHKATEFCCGSEKVDINFQFSGDTIIIQEIDKGPFSYCFCKHDISFNFGPLDYGIYKVKMIESENSYKRDTIMFELNHTSNTNFSNCK